MNMQDIIFLNKLRNQHICIDIELSLIDSLRFSSFLILFDQMLTYKHLRDRYPSGSDCRPFD
jgi:hypothetical protein